MENTAVIEGIHCLDDEGEGEGMLTLVLQKYYFPY